MILYGFQQSCGRVGDDKIKISHLAQLLLSNDGPLQIYNWDVDTVARYRVVVQVIFKLESYRHGGDRKLDITVLFVGTTNFCIRFISYVLLPDAADIKGIQRGIKTFG